MGCWEQPKTRGHLSHGLKVVSGQRCMLPFTHCMVHDVGSGPAIISIPAVEKEAKQDNQLTPKSSTQKWHTAPYILTL